MRVGDQVLVPDRRMGRGQLQHPKEHEPAAAGAAAVEAKHKLVQVRVTTQEFTFEPRAVYTGEVKAFLQFKLTEKSEADFTGDTFQDPAYSLGAETAGHSTASEQPPPTRRWLQGLSIGN